MRNENRFHDAREAKEFLISRIVEEAQREGVTLSDLERKMLYFSESGWTLPDMMEVSEEFDRLRDQAEYEKKITALIRKASKRIRKESSEAYEEWWAAIRLLKREDHYILVMVSRAGVRPPGDLLKLWGTGLALVCLLSVAMFISNKYKIDLGKYVPSGNALGWCLWLTALAFVVGYSVLRLIVGGSKMDELT